MRRLGGLDKLLFSIGTASLLTGIATIYKGMNETPALPEKPALILEDENLTRIVDYSLSVITDPQETSPSALRINSMEYARSLIQKNKLRGSTSFLEATIEFKNSTKEYDQTNNLVVGGLTLTTIGAFISLITYFSASKLVPKN